MEVVWGQKSKPTVLSKNLWFIYPKTQAIERVFGQDIRDLVYKTKHIAILDRKYFAENWSLPVSALGVAKYKLER